VVASDAAHPREPRGFTRLARFIKPSRRRYRGLI
jgi:hypothetical protein